MDSGRGAEGRSTGNMTSVLLNISGQGTRKNDRKRVTKAAIQSFGSHHVRRRQPPLQKGEEE